MYDTNAEYGNNVNDGFSDAFSSKAIRMGFIRKVYGIVSIQLLFTFGLLFLFNQGPGMKQFASSNWWLLIVAAVGALATMIPLVCCNLHRNFPTNFILLGLFTIFQSISLGFVGAFSKGEIVLYAFAITAVIVISLTAFAFQTKLDFTVCGGALLIIMVIFMMCGLIISFFHVSKPIVIVFAGIGAFIFSMFLLIDTQMIIGGKHRNQYSPEDYVLASISIYLDVINIFLYILRILDALNSD